MGSREAHSVKETIFSFETVTFRRRRFICHSGCLTSALESGATLGQGIFIDFSLFEIILVLENFPPKIKVWV
jgi:hypothetical protein